MSEPATKKCCLDEEEQFTNVEDEPLTCTQKVERPLAGIIAYVDVRSGRRSCVNTSQSISHSLTALGASIAPRLTKDVTHMVFKDGKTSRERMDNYNCYLVNPLWVDACKRCNERVSEAKYPVISQNSGDSPVVLGRMKRIKSMQPKPLSEEAIIRSVERNRKRRQEGGLESRSKKMTPTRTPTRFVLANDEEVAENPSEERHQSTDSSELFELPAVVTPTTPRTVLQKEKSHNKSPQNDCTPSALSRHTPPDDVASSALKVSKTHSTSQTIEKCSKPSKAKRTNTSLTQTSPRIEHPTPSKTMRGNSKTEPTSQKAEKRSKPSELKITSTSLPKSAAKIESATPSKTASTNQKLDQGQTTATTRVTKCLKETGPASKENKRPNAKTKLPGEEPKLSLSRMEGAATKRSRKRVSFNGQKPTLVLTSVQPQDLEIVYSIAKKLGHFETSRYVDDKTTHVVSGASRRTFNILAATAKGCWILSLEWVWKSLEAGHWLNEEAFEMVTEFPAAQFFRLERQQGGVLYRPTLFYPAGSIYISSDTSPGPQLLERLLGYAGAKVTASKRKADICVGRTALDSPTAATVVSESWVLDSISEHALLPYEDFVVDENNFSPSSSPEL